MESEFNPRYHQQRSSNVQDSLVAVAGGAAIAAGSLMPFVTVASPGVTMSPAQKGASVLFGLIVVALGFTLRVPRRAGRVIAGIAILGLCALTVLGYIGDLHSRDRHLPRDSWQRGRGHSGNQVIPSPGAPVTRSRSAAA